MEARQGRGRSSGQEMSQRGDKTDLSRMKSDLGASFLRAAKSGNYELVMEFLNDARVSINASNANGLNALHLAAKDGHVRIVTELLNHGIDIDSATKKGNTALHIASLAGHMDVVKVLVQYRAKINSQAQDGFTPLYMAAQENHADVVKYLLDKGANVNLATEEGFTPLAVALQQDHSQVVKILTEASQKGRVKLSALHVAAKKDDVRAALMLLENEQNQRDRSKPSEIINEPTKSGFTPLHIAAHYGNQNVAAVLIDHGAEVDFRARNSITPLHVATKWGRKNIVSLLLHSQAAVDCKTKDGLTPLHCAARSGHDLVVNMLLESRAPVSAKTRNGLTALHMAAQGDHVDCARILISHKASVDEVTVDYLTPLHVAAHCGNVATAKLLLDRNCEVNARALNGFTPLHIACKKNRIKVIELLLQYGASIVSTTESGLTPLHVASFMGYLEIVEMLLVRKCDPNAPTVRGETPLHLATRGNQVDVMRLLLKRGAQVDAKAKEDQTPLHTAARTGSVDAILVLLQHKAAPNAPTKELYTPLHIAAKEGHEEVIQVLLENDADIALKTSKGFSPLHIAAKYGNVNASRVLLSNGSDPNGVGKNGLTPLHVATHYNQVEVAQLLLDKGSRPHATAKNGYTPLHIAAKKNEIEIATALLDHGAKPNAESRNGFIPLHLAAQEGHAEMVQLLLRRGTNQNSRAKNGLTPMHLAAQEDHVPVAEVLVKHRAEVDPQTKAGYTPLHAACHFGQLNMIRFLLDNGASVHSTTKAGHTPLHQAAQQGHVLVINMLLRCRADPNALTANGQTPLSIAQCLGYISVVEILKEITEVSVTEVDDSYRYKLMAPEVMQEAAMSDEDEDDEADERHLADQSYQFLTTGDDIGGLHEEHGGEIGIVQGKDQDPFAYDQRSSLHSSCGIGPTQEDMRYTADDADSQFGGSYSQRGDMKSWPKGASRELREGGSMPLVRSSPKTRRATEDQVYYLENGKSPREEADFDKASESTRKRSKFQAVTHVEETVLTKRIFREEHGFAETHFDNEPSSPEGVEPSREMEVESQPPYCVLVPAKDQYDIRDIAEQESAGADEALWRSTGAAHLRPGENRFIREDPVSDSSVSGPARDQYDVRDFTEQKAADVDEALWKSSGVAQLRPGESRVFRKDQAPDSNDTKLMQEPPLDLEHQVVTVEEVVKDTERKYDLLAAPPDVPLYRSNLSETDSRMFGSTYSGMSYASSLDPDNVALHRQPIFSGFLVSFLVDARGGAMRGCRHSGIRIIIPPGRACMPTRVTCKLVKKEKLPQVPPLMEGEALASRVLVMGPSGAKFLGPVILEVPHFASLRGTEREITVLRSENGLTWKEHSDLATLDSMQNTLCGSFEDLESAEELYNRRITRIITSDFPKYFAIVTRIRQETSMLTQKGGVVSSIIIPQVKTVFPPGAVTKNIKLGLQAHPISDELVFKNTGNKLSVSPVVTIEPRRRKFHLPITVTIPLPPNLQTAKPVDKIPTLRLFCSMNAAMDPTEWEDITGSTPLTLTNNCASFTTTVSARFWLINAVSPKESLPIASRLYSEALVVPFMANFVIFAKRLDVLDAQLRLFCMTDDKMDKTLESQERFAEIARSREVEVLDGKPQWIECVGNLLPVIKSDKSDKQPRINFRAFRENRQSLNVRIRDVDHDPSGNLLFMREPRSLKEQIPICNLTVTLPSGVGDEPAGHTVDSVELQEKLKALKQIEIPEDEVISKAELRLTDIAECLDEDWIPLAKQLGLTSEDITKVEKDYSYVTEQALVMLHLWIEKNKDAASGNALERSLRAIKREDIITKCICSVEEVTDVKEKQVAKTYFNSGDRDRPGQDLDLDHGQQNGLLESPTEAPYVARQVSKNRQTIGGRENLADDEVLSFVKQQAMSVLANRLAQEQQQQQQQDRVHPSINVEVELIIPDNVPKDHCLTIVATKTPPSTPADMETIHSPTDITESEIVASFAKKDKRNLENDYNEPVLTDDEVHQIPISKEPHVPNIEQEDTGAEEIVQTSSEAVPLANGSTADSTSWPGVEETSFEDWVERKEMGYSDPSRRAMLIHENSKELVAGEVRTQTIDGELDLRIEIDEDEEVTDDGTLIRRQVITRRHVCPVTEITTVGGVESDRRNVDRLVKVEVEEDILELPPGVDESADQENLATRTSVSESDETLPEGVPLHRRVTRTTIVPGVSGEIESHAGKMVDDAFGEILDEMRAGSFGERDALDHGDDIDAAVLRVYTDTKEGIPEVETDVQEFEEVLDDGTVVRRRIVKTKQKQTITKRVVVEGPEDELPENEEEAQEMLRRVEAGEPGPTGGAAAETRRDGAKKPETSVQEYEETLPDGTVMKRRIITTTEQQLTTERVVLEADDDDEDDDTGDEHIPNSQGGVDGTDMQVVKPDSDDEETAVVMLKKEIRRKKIIRDGKEEMIITEDVRLVQDEEEPEELRDSVQTIIDQFMEGSSYDVDSSFGQLHK